jgi:hypothetical protein
MGVLSGFSFMHAWPGSAGSSTELHGYGFGSVDGSRALPQVALSG